MDSRPSVTGKTTGLSAVLRAIERAFELRSAVAVRECLRSRPELLDLLLQVPEHVREHFGPDVRLVLDMRPDREGFEPPELFACVVTDMPAEEAWDRMFRLDREWWIDAADEKPVNLHVEFA